MPIYVIRVPELYYREMEIEADNAFGALQEASDKVAAITDGDCEDVIFHKCLEPGEIENAPWLVKQEGDSEFIPIDEEL